jgi:hypothetical protein
MNPKLAFAYFMRRKDLFSLMEFQYCPKYRKIDESTKVFISFSLNNATIDIMNNQTKQPTNKHSI